MRVFFVINSQNLDIGDMIVRKQPFPIHRQQFEWDIEDGEWYNIYDPDDVDTGPHEKKAMDKFLSNWKDELLAKHFMHDQPLLLSHYYTPEDLKKKYSSIVTKSLMDASDDKKVHRKFRGYQDCSNIVADYVLQLLFNDILDAADAATVDAPTADAASDETVYDNNSTLS